MKFLKKSREIYKFFREIKNLEKFKNKITRDSESRKLKKLSIFSRPDFSRQKLYLQVFNHKVGKIQNLVLIPQKFKYEPTFSSEANSTIATR